MKRKKNWIPKDLDEGAFTRKAKQRGMTAQEFARVVTSNPDKYDTKTVRQANLAKTFAKMAKKRKGK